MAVPKSKKLQREEAAEAAKETSQAPSSLATPTPPKNVIKIRPVKCHNDFVAVLQATIETVIELAGTENQFLNEGLVIGVGPGISDGTGGRLPPTVAVGDYVMFGPRNIAATLEPKDGPYKDKKVVIVSERNILCNLQGSIPHEIEEE